VKRTVSVSVILFVILIVIFLSRRSSHRTAISSTNSAIQSAPAPNIQVTEIPLSPPSSATPNQSPPLLGETILRDYANTNLSPQNDLTLVSRLMDNSRLLLKSAANRPLSANEDWADFLRGKNSAHERFLPDQHIALNSKGQLAVVSDSTTATWGATITGGGANVVLAFCNGTNWKVAG